MDPFNISGVLRSESHQSWINFWGAGGWGVGGGGLTSLPGLSCYPAPLVKMNVKMVCNDEIDLFVFFLPQLTLC